MIKIKIKKVEIGACYQNKTYNYWVVGEMCDGTTIRIFDEDPIDLRKLKGKSPYLFIQLFEPQLDDNGMEFTYVGKVQNHKFGNFHKLKNKCGSFYISLNEDIKFEKNKKYKLKIIRFDLLGINKI